MTQTAIEQVRVIDDPIALIGAARIFRAARARRLAAERDRALVEADAR